MKRLKGFEGMGYIFQRGKDSEKGLLFRVGKGGATPREESSKGKENFLNHEGGGLWPLYQKEALLNCVKRSSKKGGRLPLKGRKGRSPKVKIKIGKTS